MAINQYSTDFLSSESVKSMMDKIDKGADKKSVVDEHFKLYSFG